jgi:hypothetical protein
MDRLKDRQKVCKEGDRDCKLRRPTGCHHLILIRARASDHSAVRDTNRSEYKGPSPVLSPDGDPPVEVTVCHKAVLTHTMS